MTTPGWARCRSNAQGGLRAEPTCAGGLGDDLRRGQIAAAGQCEETWSEHLHDGADLVLKLVDPHGELPRPTDKLPGELGHRALDGAELLIEVVENLEPS